MDCVLLELKSLVSRIRGLQPGGRGSGVDGESWGRGSDGVGEWWGRGSGGRLVSVSVITNYSIRHLLSTPAMRSNARNAKQSEGIRLLRNASLRP